MSGTTQTIVQQQTIADQPTGWSQTLGFNQFNPSLGTLQLVALGVSADLNGGAVVESLEAAPSTISVSADGYVSANAASGLLSAYANPYDTASASLAPFDGSADFAGPSSATLGLSASDNASSTTSASADLSPAVGTGVVPTTVNAGTYVDVEGPANLNIITGANIGAVTTLLYAFTPPSGGGGGGGWSSAGVGIETTFLGPLPPGMSPVTTTTAPQNFTFADRTSGWSDRLTAAKFDPSLGKLAAVNITINADLVSTIAAENLGATAQGVQATQIVTVALGGSGEPFDVTASPTASVNDYLSGFDGTTDFSGGSGFTTSGTYFGSTQSSSLFDSWADGPTSQQLTDAASLAAFTGSGSIVVPVTTTGTSTLSGPGNMDALLRALAGATVSISYTYSPVGVPSTSDVLWDSNGGDWSNPETWWSAQVPAAPDDVAIIHSGTYAITLDAAATIHSLVLDSPGATLILDSNLTTTGDIILDAGTIEFAGGTLTAADVILNGGEITGGTVDIDATGSIAFNGGSIVADDVVLQSGSTISGGLITPASAFITTGTASAVVATGSGITSSLPPGAITTTGSTYKLTTDNVSFHAGASGALVGIKGTSDRVYGGAGADTVFGNDGAWVRGGTDTLLFSGGTHANSTIVGAAGVSTLYGGSGGNNFLTAGKGNALIVAGGNDIVWGGSGSDTIAGGSATSTVVGGSGAETVFAGSAPMLVYGGTGSLVFVGGTSGGNTVLGGAGAATLFGGSAGSNILIGGAGHAVIVGGGSGDMLMAGGNAGDILYAGAGNETLTGSASGADMLSAGSGNDVIFAGGGADTLMAGTGVANMIGGSGADLFVFTSGMSGGADAIWNFQQGTDHVLLANYGTDAVANALSSAIVHGSSTTITLSDNTQITFGGISHLTTSDFA